jgi:tetratricopeptide (TPR) repeat protein
MRGRAAGAGGPGRARRAALVVAALLAAASGGAGAATPGELFAQGNEAYRAGRYEEAASAYQRILDGGVRDPRVHYNLGNAFFKLGRLGAAILHYERAVRLDPSDRDARENLEFARGLIRDRVPEPEIPYPVQALKGIVDALSIDRVTLGFLLPYLLAGGLLGGLPLAHGYARRRALGYGAAAAGVVALLAGGAFAYKAHDVTSERAIVMQDRVDVRSGPAQDNTVLFTLHEGTRLMVRNKREGWCQISLPNALSGWVPAATLEPV